MESIEIIRLLERYIQGNPLSALAAGVALGAFLCLVAMQVIRALRHTRPPDPTVSRGSTGPLSHMEQDSKLDWFSTVLIRIFFWCKNLQIYKGGVALGSGS